MPGNGYCLPIGSLFPGDELIGGTMKSCKKTITILLTAASWLAIMLLIAPAISLVAIAVTVRSSAKAQTIEEAQ